MPIKARYYNLCIRPALLYASETWALTKSMELRLARCQRAIERRMLGVRLRDRHSVAWIREKTGLEDVVSSYRKRKWKHANKVVGATHSERWDQRLLLWTPPGKRPLGRPRRRWQDDLVRTAGKNWQMKANDQRTWMKLRDEYMAHSD